MNTRTFEDYCKALEGAGQREKEALLAQMDGDRHFEAFDLNRLRRLAYPEEC